MFVTVLKLELFFWSLLKADPLIAYVCPHLRDFHLVGVAVQSISVDVGHVANYSADYGTFPSIILLWCLFLNPVTGLLEFVSLNSFVVMFTYTYILSLWDSPFFPCVKAQSGCFDVLKNLCPSCNVRGKKKKIVMKA